MKIRDFKKLLLVTALTATFATGCGTQNPTDNKSSDEAAIVAESTEQTAAIAPEDIIPSASDKRIDEIIDGYDHTTCLEEQPVKKNQQIQYTSDGIPFVTVSFNDAEHVDYQEFIEKKFATDSNLSTTDASQHVR
ncbi:hypothetical protein SAMN02910370_01199 [Lachnospiraceae bacterium XPB1003]|nr:hypothetical protein SAMN02910370_01199 [Lachnospiraceae bacterium XPB1003]